MRPSLSRSFLGAFLIGAAVLTRCLAASNGGVVTTFGPHLPALTVLDFFTAPVAFGGIAVLAGGRGLAPLRRALGLLALVAAVAWPAIKFGEVTPVLFRISARHGIHAHDLVAFPVLAAAMALLVPWRSALRPLGLASGADHGAPLRPAVRH